MKKYEKDILQSQLNSEKRALEELKRVYEKASQDCADKIAALSARTDMENLQSIIYQKQYQQALKKQIDGILDVLHGDEFESISAYLHECYEDGYISMKEKNLITCHRGVVQLKRNYADQRIPLLLRNLEFNEEKKEIAVKAANI